MSEQQPPVPISTTEAEDEAHRRAERRAFALRRERYAALSFGVSVLAAIGLGVVYWQGGQAQLEGTCLALIFGGLGVGFIVWAKHFMPHEEVTEERHDLASSDEELVAFREEFERGEEVLVRRGVLVKAAGAAVVALGAALIFPIRSLGPRPGKGLKSTPFGPGVRLVDESNHPVKPTDLVTDGVLTVFPQDHTDAADASTVLIRPGQTIKPRKGRETWTPDGIVAYSKLCTHVGCPVGLYQAEEHLLLCPCHQSTFDVLDGARPIFGPAARSLPQLPLSIDAEGYLISTGDFSSPTGPGFWDRDR
ncbi:MAG: Rieske (2Fe-2S) domain protein [Ilumatobacteraceae bacterium]|nr:Rieske (2Fe-2S) domain protein [Ilumatobacteraceae bacterium]